LIRAGEPGILEPAGPMDPAAAWIPVTGTETETTAPPTARPRVARAWSSPGGQLPRGSLADRETV